MSESTVSKELYEACYGLMISAREQARRAANRAEVCEELLVSLVARVTLLEREVARNNGVDQ